MIKVLKMVLGCAVIALLSAGAGLGYNALRGQGDLPLVASEGYYDNKVFVPCPEVLSHPEALEPSRVLRWNPDRLLVVDAREEEAFAKGHHEGSVSFPYSVLFPPEPSEVTALIARAGERTLVVCGDPEIGSGELLAADFMQAGVEQVYHVKGGCEALMQGQACKGPGR